MRTLVYAALVASTAIVTTPLAAQVATGGMRSTVGTGGSWHVPRPNAGGGTWTAPRPTQPGNWNAPRPTQPGNWNNTPRPPKPGNWNNAPRPTPTGGWNNNPRPTPPGGWNNAPRPTPPGGSNNNPRPTPPGGWNNNPGKPGGWSNNNPRPSRWGNKIGGHWYAGHNAPGGWKGYRRPTRGWTLPRYWIAPSFFIGDYSSYGLAQPGYGYNWTRYYDDAVLTDSYGQVWDSVSGVDWDRYGGYDDGSYGGGYGGGYQDDGYYAESGYAQGGNDGYDDRRQGYGERRDNGVGGAVIGGVVGGVAGNVIGGRGHRTAGTLIGAGVGAVAGYAIDKAEDRGRRAPPRGYGAPYAPPPVAYAPSREIVQGDGYTTSYHAGYGQSGYASGGYWYPPAVTTTVTIGAPTVETVTTTTEYVEERASYTTARKTWRPAPKKKVWKAVRRCSCN